MKKFKIKKCESCGAIVEVMEDCTCKNCGIQCCGKPMKTLTPNTVECAVEKHKPTYEVVGEYIVASVNHVMEDEHYIDFICLVTKTGVEKKYLEKGKNATAVFKYVKGSTLYAYCNKHGLWSTDVK